MLFTSMAAHKIIQQRLFDLCREPTYRNDGESLLLKNVLTEIYKEERLYLLDAEDETNRAPLFYAIESGKPLDFIRQLLECDVRITSRILLCAIRYGNLDILKLLNQYGADFRQSYHGLSLLHECILLHKNHLISFLIEEGGISPDVVDYDNQTPLLFAIFRINIEAIFILLRYSRIDPCSISTRKQRLTCFHVACELGIDEVLPSMIKNISITNINKLSANDQTAFDLFLSCYLFTKRSLDKDEILLEKFSTLFDLFISNGAKLHHLTKAYRRTRAEYVTKILIIIFKKNILLSDIILQTDRSTILVDLQSLACQSLGDWPYIIESNDNITIKQRQLILRQLFELFLIIYYKSINRQIINKKLLTRYCLANDKDSKVKKILWIFIKNFIEPKKEIGLLKSICRTNILLNLNSVDKDCTNINLSISKDLENYLLYFTMN